MLNKDEKISLEAAGLLVFLDNDRRKRVITAAPVSNYFTDSTTQIKGIFREPAALGYMKEVLF